MEQMSTILLHTISLDGNSKLPVTVAPYKPSRPHDFVTTKNELEVALDGVPFVSIEHVGSTSIPHLAAKPVLDIDVVATRDQLHCVVEAHQRPDLQLIYMGELGIADRHAFRAPQRVPIRNLYVCIEGSTALRNHLAVRDLLRSDEGLRREYGALKAELAAGGMEIHEYMSAKSTFMMKMLSHQLTDAEIEDIRKATSSAVRMAPIRLAHLVLREFVIGDVDALLQTGLVSTLKEVEGLAVENIRDAGMVKRKHVELANLVRKDRAGSEDVQMVGRVGVKIVEDEQTKTADGSLRRVLNPIPTESKPVGRMGLLYVFIDPRRDDEGIAREELDMFPPALSQNVQGMKDEDGTATGTDLETVWHLLESSTLVQMYNGNVKGGIVFSIGSTITTRSQPVAQITLPDVRLYTAIVHKSSDIDLADLEKFVTSKVQPGKESAVKPLTRNDKTFGWAGLYLDDTAKEEIADHEGVLGIEESLKVSHSVFT